MTTTVDRLASAGFFIGPDPEGPCEVEECQHLWGNHMLVAPGIDPLDGGYWTCPYVGCRCTGEWDLSPEAQAKAREYRRRKAEGETQ